MTSYNVQYSAKKISSYDTVAVLFPRNHVAITNVLRPTIVLMHRVAHGIRAAHVTMVTVHY